MQRQGVGFHDDQYAFLSKEAGKRKVSISQIIREVVTLGIAAYKKQ